MFRARKSSKPASIDEFTGVLIKSGLVTSDTAIAARDAFLESTADDRTLDGFCESLVESELITAWQCEKLLAGKYKGFFQDDYRLLEKLESRGAEIICRAEHTPTGNAVTAAIRLMKQRPYIIVREWSG